MDRDRAAGQRLDLLGVDVARDHLMAELGEAGSRHQADPADSDHADRLTPGLHQPAFPVFGFGFGLGISTLVERARLTIWLLVRVLSRSFDTQ